MTMRHLIEQDSPFLFSLQYEIKAVEIHKAALYHLIENICKYHSDVHGKVLIMNLAHYNDSHEFL